MRRLHNIALTAPENCMPLFQIDVQYGDQTPQRISNFAPDDAAARATGLAMVASFGSDVQRLEHDGVIVVRVTDESSRPISTVRLVCSIV